MRELDYRPNSLARALVTGRSRTLGVVSFDTTLYGPASTLFGHRARGARGGLLRHHRQPALARPLLGAERRRAAARPGRRRHPRHRPAGVPRPGAAAPARRRPGGRRRGRPPDARVPVVAVDQFAGALPPPGTCSSSATARSGTSPGPPTGSRPSSASRAGGRRSRPPAPPAPPVLPATGAPRSGYELGRRLPADPRRHRRSSSPTTRWRSACSARCTRRGAASPSDISVVGFDDIPEAAVLHAAAHDRAPGLQRDGPPAACCCSARRVRRRPRAPSARRSRPS